jgi:hypothetical protein
VIKKKMIATGTALTVLLIAGCFVFKTILKADLPDNIDTAKRLYLGLDLKGTERVLQQISAAPEGQPKLRAEAIIMQARIAWKFYKNSRQARELLRQAEDLKEKEYEILTLLSRVERESGEFQKALGTGSRAIERATSERQWVEARSLWAQVIWEQSLTRIEKNQPFDRHLVEQGVATLKEVLRKTPGCPGPSRILLGLALLAQDGEAAFTAWKSYFNIVEDDPPKGILAGPYGLLRGVLPRWRSRRLSRKEGLMLIRGLGDSRFYGYSKHVKQLFFTNDPFSDEPDVRDMLLYADTIDSFRKTAEEYYRMLSLANKDEVAFESSFLKDAEGLWMALSFAGERPDFSFENFGAEMKKRFGTHIILGGTGNYRGKVLIMGHLIDLQTRKIEQYGFESEFSYLLYDMMVSNGYSSWFWDGMANVGGWATATEMAAVRTGTIQKFYRLWWMVNDDAERKKTEQYIAERLDAEELAISKSISAPLNGLSRRMRFKATKALVDGLKDSGLEAHDLIMAFIRRYDQFQVGKNIFAHEGRHSIDQKFFADDYNHWSSSEKEFRAKLSEVIFCSDPYLALGELLAQSVSGSAHGKANLKIRKVLLKWMKEHLSEIEDIDTDRPLLVQTHLLTNDQIKQCFTAADPLARKSRFR